MGHFAKIENGTVTRVIVAEQDFINTGAVGNPHQWVRTSYNTRGGVHYDPQTGEPSEDQSKALRKNYAGSGYSYDQERDAFIPPKPYESWTLDETTCLWEPPVAYPSDGGMYYWDESTTNWVAAESGE